jgi:hypothetical protein
VILCVPVASAAVDTVANPSLSVRVPRLVPLSTKFTVPVRLPSVEVFTVAVMVTEFPDLEGFIDDFIVVVLFALSTTWLNAGDVLPAKLDVPA